MLVTALSGARPMPTDCPALFFAAISAECQLCRGAIGGAIAGYLPRVHASATRINSDSPTRRPLVPLCRTAQDVAYNLSVFGLLMRVKRNSLTATSMLIRLQLFPRQRSLNPE